ncbi:MAG: hypothetical protein U0031_15910 [Thermomicrobiales bacterium]
MKRGALRGLTSPELVTLIISLLVVGAMIWVGVREDRNRQEGIAGEITMALDSDHAELRNGTYFIPYVISNTGSVAITSAEVWVEVYSGDSLVESAEIRVSSLPLHGTQDGIYVTALDPSTHDFRGRLESVQFP